MSRKRLFIVLSVAIVLLILSLFFGTAPPSPLYYLKITRETIQSYFIFGQEDRANWLLTRADKRISEAQKLKDKNLDFLAQIQTNIAWEYQWEVDELLRDLKNKTNITYLTDKSNQNLDRLKIWR